MKKILLTVMCLFAISAICSAWGPASLSPDLSIYTVEYISSITSTTALSPNVTYNIIQSSGGEVFVNQAGTADTISTTGVVEGTYIIYSSTATGRDVVFTEGATQNLFLGAATRTVGLRDVLILMFDGIDWVEASYTAN